MVLLALILVFVFGVSANGNGLLIEDYGPVECGADRTASGDFAYTYFIPMTITNTGESGASTEEPGYFNVEFYSDITDITSATRYNTGVFERCVNIGVLEPFERRTVNVPLFTVGRYSVRFDKIKCIEVDLYYYASTLRRLSGFYSGGTFVDKFRVSLEAWPFGPPRLELTFGSVRRERSGSFPDSDRVQDTYYVTVNVKNVSEEVCYGEIINCSVPEEEELEAAFSAAGYNFCEAFGTQFPLTLWVQSLGPGETMSGEVEAFSIEVWHGKEPGLAQVVSGVTVDFYYTISRFWELHDYSSPEPIFAGTLNVPLVPWSAEE